MFLLVALDTWKHLFKFSLSDQILRTLDRPTRVLQLVVCLAVGQEIAMSHILCDREVVVGEEVLRYCFKALTSYQRVSAAADFGDAGSASVFLEVVGALRGASVNVLVVSSFTDGFSLFGLGIPYLLRTWCCGPMRLETGTTGSSH